MYFYSIYTSNLANNSATNAIRYLSKIIVPNFSLKDDLGYSFCNSTKKPIYYFNYCLQSDDIFIVVFALEIHDIQCSKTHVT